MSAPRVERLGEGEDHLALLVDGSLVVRVAKGPGSAEREARVLAAVAGVSPLPVPVPLFAEQGCLVYERLPGVPLLDLLFGAEPVAVDRGAIATQLVALLDVLHRLEPEGVAVDDAPPSAWLDEARETYAAVRGELPAAAARAFAAWLERPPPEPAGELVFSHNDLGIEHVLVDPATHAITGVVDWSDAARVDPACDLGRLVRDLGPAAVPGASERVLFYARCGLLEDLAYGLRTERLAYVRKSLAHDLLATVKDG